jgi:hypothetical protein
MGKARLVRALAVALAFGGIAPVVYCIMLAAWNLREMQPEQFSIGLAGLLTSALGLLIAARQAPLVRNEAQSREDRMRRLRIGQYSPDGGRKEPFIGPGIIGSD